MANESKHDGARDRAITPRLGHLELFVRDVDRARASYQEALGFEPADVPPEAGAWLQAGESALVLRPGRTAPPPASYRDAATAFVLYVDDLDAGMARLREHGVRFEDDDGSARCPTFRGPDGHWFQLVDPRDFS